MDIKTSNRLGRNWDRLCIICNDIILVSGATITGHDLFGKYMKLLYDVKEDVKVITKSPGDPITLLGLYRAPGSKDRHHDHVGGLVEHMLEMWTLWGMWKQFLNESAIPYSAELNDQNVWRAILHHDLNKIHRYRLVTEDPFAVEYYEHDRATLLLGSTNKSLWILQNYGIPLDLTLMNALICSEGGYSKIRPSLETPFAKLMYLLDEGSANILFRLNTNRFWDPKAGGENEIG